ncbi:UTP--glucose-1-phosphate uridylyltransferase GalU [Desulfosporosinus sp. Sb-LF]|uniref:UTP--glucose-1-phosphate uridylyltransferase GalU n=1 Tax=Desulfosporosinus sp. Sb-LF TaxID=2560027 RepID=UPI00107F19CD|nr:UTP--glucose-1-phosphate uridylyltransferase GalU [Desulfosporosinus sp. Sb-LF]TGE31477.1 UTP--glucose-1-phosphate uridylyltransferase GalU [Desulfosporosinus sp. Sb-LF]
METNFKIRKAVIPAAGLGTRFLPFTKSQPKEMLPIIDKPTIQFIIEEAVNSGIDSIIIITGRNKRAIEDHFDYSIELETFLKNTGKQDLLDIVQDISKLADIHYIRQKEALGLGHAIYTARKFIGNEPFAVLLGDDVIYSEIPCLKQMITVYEQYGTPVLGVQQVSQEDVSKYGIVDGEVKCDRIYKARNLIEKPNPKDAPATRLAIMGRYIISPDIFDILENLTPGKGGEIQLTDGLRELSKKHDILAYDFKGRRYDVGDKFGFLQANIEYGLRSKEFSDTLMQYLRELVFRS